jgi:sugar transferase (PEP-CTERM/EpsH1 system associated)
MTGARLRDFHLARELTRLGTLTYVGFSSQPEPVRRERLEPLANADVILVRRDGGYRAFDLLRGLAGPKPISVLNYTSRAMIAELERLLAAESFDVIQIEGVHLFSYVQRIRQLAPRSRLVADWHNVESELMARYAEKAPGLARRWYASRTTSLLRRLERRLLDLCDAHTVCSERERQLLLEQAPGARIEVVGNGVDVGFYSETAGRSNEPRRRVVFVGSMDYHANIDAALYFARDIWPEVHARRPELEFVIVGSRPVEEILRLGDQPEITVTGTVDDVRPYYRSALAVVVPLRVGSGTRLKVLEAMAAGTPVISTALGAEGLAVRHGEHLLIADSPHAMADAVAELQDGSAEWESLAANAHRLVRSQYDWSIIGEALRRLYAEQLEGACA